MLETEGARTVPIRTAPMPGETALSFLSRVAEANWYDSIRWFLRDEWSGRWDVASWPNELRNKVAVLAGIEIEQLDALSYTKVLAPQSRFRHERRFLNSSLPYAFLKIETKRFCPLCLQESRPHHALFDIKQLEACPWHGCRLENKCRHCGSITKWGAGSLSRCTSCRGDLRDNSPKKASRAELAPSLLLARHASLQDTMNLGVDLPEAVLPFNLGQLIDFLAALGRLQNMTHGHAFDRRALDTGRSDLRGSIATLEDWPRNFNRSIERIAALTPEFNGDFEDLRSFPSARAILGGHFRRFILTYNVEPFVFLLKCLRSCAMERRRSAAFSSRPPRLLSEDDLCLRDLVSLRSMASDVSLGYSALKKFARSGKFQTFVQHSESPLVLVDRTEVIDFARKYHFSAKSAAIRLGVSVYNCRLLINAGVISQESSFADEYGLAVFSEEKIVQIESFFEACTSTASGYSKYISINSAIYILSLYKISLQLFFDEISSGKLNTTKLAGGFGIARYLLNSDDLKRFCIASTRTRLESSDAMLTIDAMRLLHCSIDQIRKLSDANIIRPSPDIGVLSTVCRRSAFEFHERFIFSREIAEKRSLSLRFVGRVIRMKSISRADASKDISIRFYSRDACDWWAANWHLR